MPSGRIEEDLCNLAVAWFTCYLNIFVNSKPLFCEKINTIYTAIMMYDRFTFNFKGVIQVDA